MSKSERCAQEMVHSFLVASSRDVVDVATSVVVVEVFHHVVVVRLLEVLVVVLSRHDRIDPNRHPCRRSVCSDGSWASWE